MSTVMYQMEITSNEIKNYLKKKPLGLTEKENVNIGKYNNRKMLLNVQKSSPDI